MNKSLERSTFISSSYPTQDTSALLHRTQGFTDRRASSKSQVLPLFTLSLNIEQEVGAAHIHARGEATRTLYELLADLQAWDPQEDRLYWWQHIHPRPIDTWWCHIDKKRVDRQAGINKPRQRRSLVVVVSQQVEGATTWLIPEGAVVTQPQLL